MLALAKLYKSTLLIPAVRDLNTLLKVRPHLLFFSMFSWVKPSVSMKIHGSGNFPGHFSPQVQVGFTMLTNRKLLGLNVTSV